MGFFEYFSRLIHKNFTGKKEFVGGLDHIPRSRGGVRTAFGNPVNSHGGLDMGWFRRNIKEYRGELPGVMPGRYVKMHRLAAPYAKEALQRASDASDYKIFRFGDFVFRHQRHDKNRPLSYHSWGIAFDVNSEHNKSKGFGTKDKVPEPWSDEWNRIWPNGVTKEFVEAIESVGFKWGGRWGPWVDPMHFQLVGV